MPRHTQYGHELTLEGQWQADGRLKLTAIGRSARIIMVDANGKPTVDVSVPPHEYIFVIPPKDQRALDTKSTYEE